MREMLQDLRHKVRKEKQSKFFLPGFTKLLHFSHRGTSSEKIFSTNQRETVEPCRAAAIEVIEHSPPDQSSNRLKRIFAWLKIYKQ